MGFAAPHVCQGDCFHCPRIRPIGTPHPQLRQIDTACTCLVGTPPVEILVGFDHETQIMSAQVDHDGVVKEAQYRHRIGNEGLGIRQMASAASTRFLSASGRSNPASCTIAIRDSTVPSLWQ